jgi:DNA-binding HxlR family transcriptional regulator
MRKREGDVPKGLRYGRGVIGKHLFRIRERHVADHLVPLMTSKAVGAAKLDLVLRGIALSPAHAGARKPGLVLTKYSWEQLHDLARTPETLGSAPPDLDAPPEVVRLKRKWVGEQLARLEALGLVQRQNRPGRRPRLFVLSDDGLGGRFDDPDGTPGNTYVTILGSLIRSGALASWGAPELSFFLAAMIAERHDAQRLNTKDVPPRPFGAGTWFRSLGWFADSEDRRPAQHVRIPFSVPTLERGLTKLEQAGLVVREHITRNPRNNSRLSGRRNHYTNRFHTLDDPTQHLDVAAYRKEIQRLDVDTDDE